MTEMNEAQLEQAKKHHRNLFIMYDIGHISKKEYIKKKKFLFRLKTTPPPPGLYFNVWDNLVVCFPSGEFCYWSDFENRFISEFGPSDFLIKTWDFISEF